MSGSKTITNIALSNLQLPQGAPPGTLVGQITVSTSDGTPFSGTVTLGGPFAGSFTVTATRDPYSISSISLSNQSLAANPPVGTLIGTISVVLSDQTVFGGAIAVNDSRFSISGSSLFVAATLTNGTTYPITITATDFASQNQTLSVPFQITVQATAAVPGPLIILPSPAQTSTTIDVLWAPPTAGGALDNGLHQIQYKTNAAPTYQNAQVVTYCTSGHGSVADASGVTWTLNAQNHPVGNGTFVDTASTVQNIIRSGALIWALDMSNVWFRSPGGIPPSWTQDNTGTPYRQTIAGLVAATTYNIRGFATNSAGTGTTSAAVNVATQAAAPLPGIPTNFRQISVASNSAIVGWDPPTAGGVLDRGRYQLQYTTSGTFTDNGPTTPYCTPSTGSVVDAFNNTWAIVPVSPAGGGEPNAVVVNGVYTNGWNATTVIMVNGVVWHVNVGGEWYSYVPTGSLGANGGSVGWVGPTSTPLSSVNIPNLTTNTTYSTRVYATNSVGSGAATATIQVRPVAGQSGNVPAPAAAVGFNTRTLGPNVTLGSNWFQSVAGSSQNSDGSVRIFGNSTYHFNDHISACSPGNPFRGVAFGGGGYFEVDMAISGTITGWCVPNTEGGDPSCTGWPAWWCSNAYGNYSALPNTMPDAQGIEYDAAEFLDASSRNFSAGIILWSGDGRLLNNSQVGQGNGFSGPVGFNFAARHKYAWLWVPATNTTQGYIKNYMDGVQFGLTYTWNKYVEGRNWQQSADNDPWAVMDKSIQKLMIGCGTNNNITVYTVTVWQANDSGNFRVGTPLPP